MRFCCINDCEREIGKHGAKGMCPTHYKRLKAGGDLSRPILPRGGYSPMCEIEDCSKPSESRGLCGKHYMRWHSHGDPTVVRNPWWNRDRTAVFLSRIGEPDQAGCRPWMGRVDVHGYGKMGRDYAYRLSYEHHVGPIPDGLTIDHLCRNPICVNPEHLEPVTRSENARRQWIGKQKTHCPAGHLYDEGNTYIDKKGGRRCRTCAHERYLRMKTQP